MNMGWCDRLVTSFNKLKKEAAIGNLFSLSGMTRLAPPQLYWVLSGSDFTLGINNPKHPKIICVGNNPEKQQIYGAVLSLVLPPIEKTAKVFTSLLFRQ